MNDQLAEIKSKTVRTIKWTVVTEIIRKLIVPVTNMLLARLLTPEMFGVVATINIIFTFTDMLSDAGFSKYLVQHIFKDQKEVYKYANIAFWANFTVSILLFLFIVWQLDIIAAGLGMTEYKEAIAVACISLPLTAMISVQQALCNKNYNYKKIFAAKVSSAIAPLIITVPIAFVTRSFWALIIGNVCNNLILMLSFIWKSEWMPGFSFDFQKLKRMLSFSIWTLVESLIVWCCGNGIIFFISQYLTKEELGYYTTSYTTVDQISALVTSATTTVLFVSLSKLQNDKDDFNHFLYEFQSKVSFILMPMGVGIFLYHDFVTDILLGAQWQNISAYVGILGLIMPFRILVNYYSSEVYRAKGQPKISSIAQIIWLVIAMPIFIFSAKIGVARLIGAYATVNLIFSVIHGVTIWHNYRISVWKMFTHMKLSIAASAIMGIFGAGIKALLGNGIFWNILGIVLCIIIYFGTVACTKKGRSIIKGFIENWK